jgi:acetylornithine deacetylase/succinyl-diaminopimelate desuccinylase-like protein
VPLSAGLTSTLAGAVEAHGLEARALVSGAGHDAAVVARVVPAAMLFVQCAGGVSHSPNESVAEQNVAVALDVLEKCVDLVALEAVGGENGSG